MINLIANKIAQSPAAVAQNPNQKGRINTSTKPYANDVFVRSNQAQIAFKGGIYVHNPRESALLKKIVEYKNSILKKMQEERELGEEMLEILGEKQSRKADISNDHLGIAKAYLEYNPDDAMCQFHAHASAKSAIAADPQNHEAHYLYGTLEGDDNEAIHHLKEAVKLAPFNTQYLTTRARKHLQAGSRDAAIADYTRLTQLEPKNPEILAEKGSAHIAFGEHQEALKDFDKAIELAPQKSEIHQGRGDSLMFLTRYDEAVQSYETALKLNPKADEANSIHTNIGSCSMIVENYPKAIEHFSEALSLAPVGDTYYKRAFSHFMLDHNEAALSDAKEAVTQGTQDISAIALQAVCLSSLGRHAESRVLIQQAKDAFPEHNFLQNQKELALYRLDYRKSKRGA